MFKLLYIVKLGNDRNKKCIIIFSCIIGALGNVVSQKLSGVKQLNEDSILAFALFG